MAYGHTILTLSSSSSIGKKIEEEEEEIHLKRDLFGRSKNAIFFFFRVLFPTIHSLILIPEKEITIFPQ